MGGDAESTRTDDYVGIRELAPSRNGHRRVRETDGTRLHRRRHTEPTEGPFNADLRQFVLNLPLDTPSAHLRNASFIGCQGVFGLLATTAVADMPVGMPTPSDSARSSASVEHKSGAIAWLDLDGLPSLRAPRLRHPRTERRGFDLGTLT